MSQKPNNTGPINKGDDAIISVVMMTVLILVVTFASWYRFHTEITYFTRLVQGFFTWPFWILNVFLVKTFNFPIPGIYHLSQMTAEICNPAGSLAFWKCVRPAESVGWFELIKSALAWNIIFGFISLWIGIKAFLRITDQHPQSKYNKAHSLESYIKEMTPVFPHLQVFGEFDMLAKDNMHGFYRGMDSTREFAKRHNLIIGKENRKIEFVLDGATHQEVDEDEFIPIIDEEKLELILKDQLGELITDVDNFTDAETIIIAYYIARAASIDEGMGDTEFDEIDIHTNEIENMYWKIASIDVKNKEEFFYDKDTLAQNKFWSSDKPRSLDSFPIEELKNHIRKYIDYPKIKNLLEKHAYVRTFIISLVYQARCLGVMAPCQILWLRLYDRGAWALVDSIGRPSMFSESLGAISHYTIESKMNKPMHEPVFTLAIKGYVFQVQSYSYEDELDDFEIGMIKKHNKFNHQDSDTSKGSNNETVTNNMVEEAITFN